MTAAADATTTDRPALVPQAHGGALYTGGVRGNKGGALQRLTSRKALKIAAANIDVLDELAKGTIKVWTDVNGRAVEKKRTVPPGIRVQAILAAWEVAKGRGKHVKLSELQRRMEVQMRILADELDPDTYERVSHRLMAEAWK